MRGEMDVAKWQVKRRLTTFTVYAKTRSKARYQAYLQYCTKVKKPKSFYSFFTSVSKVKRIED